MRLRFAGLFAVASASTILTVFIACSGGDPRPDPGNTDFGGSSSGGSGVVDAGKDSAADADAATTTCGNGQKDGDETDVDCGGTQCKPCVETKICLKKEDCEMGLECEVAEFGKTEKKCRKGTCSDTATNGGETDLNCGGTTGCDRCTVGKTCVADTDCRSGKCGGGNCACPPNMTIAPLPGGGAYCIDTTEVTKGQYDKFITSNVQPSTQTGVCASNTTFQPAAGFPISETLPSKEYNLGLPVHSVDWCDAVAYCKYAKKELCGKIGGGPVAQNEANVASTDAWYNACSANGVRTFPYTGGHKDGDCNEVGGADGGAKDYGYAQNQDPGVWRVATSDNVGNILDYVHKECNGGFTGLYQMSGNVAEWENSCANDTAPDALCNVRGGSFNTAADEADGGLEAGSLSACNSVRQLPRNAAPPDVGFRCCLY